MSRPRALRDLAVGVLRGALLLAYPFLVYTAYTRFDTRGVGAVLLGVYGALFLLRRGGSAGGLWSLARRHLGLVVLIGLAVLSGERTLLLLLPAAVSLYLLWTFASSLSPGPPLIEQIARAIEDDLPEFTLPYCRKVTIAWCVFLAANTTCAAFLAFRGPLEWWALYTGLIFYLLLGALLGGEFVLRKLWFRYYGEGLADQILAKLFPAERTANGRRSLAYVEQRRKGTQQGGAAAAQRGEAERRPEPERERSGSARPGQGGGAAAAQRGEADARPGRTRPTGAG